MKIFKYESLGNDYFVVGGGLSLTPNQVKRLCDRHYGFGSDGVLLNQSYDGIYRVAIYNSDGSRAEKSGNGIRIFARHLWDHGRFPAKQWIPIHTDQEVIPIWVEPMGQKVKVQMGQLKPAAPLTTFKKEYFETSPQRLSFYAVSLGNPHAVVFMNQPPTPAITKVWGPKIENEPRFPYRTNIQFAYIHDRKNLQIEIWERGSGYTLASGSSASAAAGLAHHLGLMDAEIAVHMPGGIIEIEATPDLHITQTGPVRRIGTCNWDPDAL
jgi:diaminopimelate epimerase